MKDSKEIATLKNIRSMHSIGARSVPKVQRSPYLDLYALNKDKDRLEKEIESLEKKKKVANRLLSDVNRLIAGLQHDVRDTGEMRTVRHTNTSRLRTMPIRY